MKLADYLHLYNLEEELWWFAGMRAITKTLLDPICPPTRDRVVLDGGCGTGGMMSWLQRYAGNGRVAGIDLSPTALKFCGKRGHTMLAQACATKLPFPDSMFDLVTSFDVLEQLPTEGSDEAALGEMLRVLRPKGVTFVRVPAYEWLKSDHDRALATQHRYSLDELTSKMKRAGFEILRTTYANSLLMPVAALRRLVLKRLGLASQGSDVKPLPAFLRWLNDPLTLALRTEARWLERPHSSLRFGLSAICVAKKA
jgi:SAM-dependent methyltransferase